MSFARWWVMGRKAYSEPLVTVVRLAGVLQAHAGPARAPAARRLLNLERVDKWLQRAFKTPGLAPAAVAVAVNSPGGAPAQAELIAGQIRRLSEETGVPAWTFAEDVAASGGYWLLCAGERAYALETSVVGGVGVISATFGARALAERAGVERRVYTAGDAKVQIDPFLPVTPDQEARLRDVMAAMHGSFARAVLAARGAALAAARARPPDAELLSGRVWTGAQAADAGVVDGVGALRDVCRERLGAGTRFLLCSDPPSAGLRDVLGLGLGGGGAGLLGGGGAGAYALARGAAEAALDAAEERALWARYRMQ